MSFDYDKIKASEEESSQWTSYSDLFMVLSTVFLLLYVVSSLRTGTYSIQRHSEYQELVRENEDLKQQIQVYNTLKDGHLSSTATQEEQQVYQNLMGKLDLLQDEAQKEENELMAKAKENQEKREALNKYQKMIRNIVNANMVAKARIDRKDELIQKKNKTITQKLNQIQNLKSEVNQKEKVVKQSRQQIESLNSELDSKIEEIKKSHERQLISKKRMEESIARLKLKTAQKVKKLSSRAKQVETELQKKNQELQSASVQLTKAHETIKAQKETEQDLSKRLEKSKGEFQKRVAELQQTYDQQVKKEREAFEQRLKRQKLSAKARAEKEKAFNESLKQKAATLKNQIAGLNQKIEESEEEIKKARARANARKDLAKRIQQNFRKAGIKANVDGETGDVVLSFGEEYFDTGRADLKPGMRDALKKFMPIYAQSLFQDAKTSNKITGVEIIGFASPTYKGRFVDPSSLDKADQKAVEYNLDLSYYRAKSIFSYAFSKDKMRFPYQKKMLPIVKVTGRSFLAESIKGRDIASGISQKEFCSKYDCKKAQKVIIKFNMD